MPAALPATLLAILMLSQAAGEQAKPQEVPAIRADLGPCTLDLRVTDADAKPLYNAKIHVQIRYGFLGKRKLDLEIGTNSEGRARFEGLPEKPNKPLEYRVTHDGKKGVVISGPSADCHASHMAVLR